jgi:hypothetical protein
LAQKAEPAKEPVLSPAVQAGSISVAAAAPQPVLFTGEANVSSKVDKLVITVGEIITYEMDVEVPRGYEVASPPQGAQLGEFLIRSYEPPKTETKGDRAIVNFIFRITSYSTGESSIPAMPIILLKDKKPVRAVLTEEIRIRVAQVSDASDMEIKDVKPPVAAPFDYEPLMITGLVLLGLAAIIVSILLIRARMRRPAIAVPEPLPEPEVLALKELADLDALGLLQKGEVDLYYTKLSEIIRRYIGLRFLIYALEFTTSEIMAALKDKWLEHATYQAIGQHLEDCDLVKFAKYSPEKKAQYEIMEKSRKIIELTRPAPKEEPAAAKAAGAA